MTTLEDKIEHYRRSPLDYFQDYLLIQTKDELVTKLTLNKEQRQVYDIIQDMRSRNQPVRVIILKARQIGVSTLCEAFVFHRTALFPNVRSLVVAHDKDTSRNLLGMSRLMYESLPKWLKPMSRYSTKSELVLENPDSKTRTEKPGLRSRMIVATAGKLSLGKSYTFQNLHCSEIPEWPSTAIAMGSLTGSVPTTPGTMVFLESTGKQMGDWFYDKWQAAKSGKDGEGYVPVFLPWFECEDYQMAPWVGFELDEVDKDLQAEYGLSELQLAWRKWKLHTEFNGDVIKFMREFPCSDTEAFIAGGGNVFDVEKLQDMLKQCVRPVVPMGRLVRQGEAVSLQVV